MRTLEPFVTNTGMPCQSSITTKQKLMIIAAAAPHSIMAGRSKEMFRESSITTEQDPVIPWKAAVFLIHKECPVRSDTITMKL